LTRLRALLLLACLAASAIGLGIILAIRSAQPATPVAAASDHAVVAVHITRDPGLVVVPTVNQTITNRGVAGKLASDIEALPAFPKGAFVCPIDFGTSYSLMFSTTSGGHWSATVFVLGCQPVKLSDSRTLWAMNATQLFADLGAALGLAPDELIPRPCPAAQSDTRCFPQPTPSSR
jgi:hypothetical protein